MTVAGIVTDVVCGMRVKSTDAAAVVDRGGERYAFCSDACADTFLRNPLRYATLAARASWSR